MSKNISKSLFEKVGALEDYSSLLHDSLIKMQSGDAFFIRQVATQLRGLVCYSSGVEGLLWRVVEDLGVSDLVQVNHKGPISETLAASTSIFYTSTFSSSSSAPFQSLRAQIKDHEAMVILGSRLTAEQIIKKIAEQMGVAHEPDVVSREIATANSILIQNVPAYTQLLESASIIVLEVCERALLAAESNGCVRQRKRINFAELKPQMHASKPAGLLKVTSSRVDRMNGCVAFEMNYELQEKNGDLAFPEIFYNSVTIRPLITAGARRFRLRTEGLPLSFFSCDVALKTLSSPLVGVLCWKGTKTALFLNGRHVAGAKAEIDPETYFLRDGVFNKK